MAVNVVSFSFSWCSTGGPGVHSAGCCKDAVKKASTQYCILSATSLVPKLHRGSQGPPRPGVAFPTISRLSPSPTLLQLRTWLLSSLSYIIVQRPLDRPLDLWNRMFDRHQAEITVMQFTGHSLLVRQSMSVPWEFFTSSHFISQFPPTRFPLITATRMSHFIPVHHLEWHFGPGRRSKYNTKCCKYNNILFTNPSARAGYDTRSIFKRSSTGLNSEFSFS